MRAVALSIDLDALPLYEGIHGCSGPTLDARAMGVAPALAAQRFGELAEKLGVRGTLFVVGQDLAAGHGVSRIRDAFAAGHEIASHSFAHAYNLSRWSPERIERDLVQTEQAIEAATGRRPVGFRAPGYTLSPALLEVLHRRGYRYDASILPSPPYYAAKATVIAALALRGRRSRSVLHGAGQWWSQRRPWWIRPGLLEIPMATTPVVRLPLIGSTLVRWPESLVRPLLRTVSPDPVVVVELHGVDLCDESDGIPPHIAALQADLRLPAAEKLRKIEAALRTLLQDRPGMTLAAVAESMPR